MKATPQGPLGSVLLLLMGLTLFVAIDVTVKSFSAALSVLVTVWFRYLFQALSMAVWMRARDIPFRTARPLQHIGRALLLLGVSVFGTLGVVRLPLGEFTTIVMLTPVMVVLLSVLLFGERVDGLRWLLLLASLSGALLVLGPTSLHLGWTVLLPVAVVLFYSSYQIVTNRMARKEHPIAMHFYNGLVGALALTAALPWLWQSLDRPLLWGVILLIGVMGTAGHLFMLLAFARTSPALLSVFLYVQVALAVLAGWLVFDHVPPPLAWLGITLIVGSGLFSALRVVARQGGLTRTAPPLSSI